MTFPPGSGDCQVCGGSPAWLDRLSGDVICVHCSVWGMVPRILLSAAEPLQDLVVQIVASADTIEDLMGLEGTTDDMLIRGVH